MKSHGLPAISKYLAKTTHSNPMLISSIQGVRPHNFLTNRIDRHDSLHHLLKPRSKEVGCDVLVGLGSLV